MSKYAQGEATVKEVRNADFLSSLTVEPANLSIEPAKKSKKKSKKK